MRRPLLLLCPLLLTGMNFTPPDPRLAAPRPVFQPETFFLGRSEGTGIIDGPFARPSAVRTSGHGRIESDGTLVLDQLIHREGHQPERRLWRLRKIGERRFSGTISDGEGPAVAEVSGNCLRIRYTIARGNLAALSHIYLQPDGKAARGRTTVRKLGLTVATIEETIRRVEAGP